MSVLQLDLLRTMLLIRRFEEQCAELHARGCIRGPLPLGAGEEAVAAGVCAALRPEDSVVSTYRDHGHAIARGVPVPAIMAEVLGRVSGCSRGRSGSMHLFDRSRHFIGINGLADGLPVAAGLALGDAAQGRDRVTVCLFGASPTTYGVFQEVVHLAVLWRLPLLLACESNQRSVERSPAGGQSTVDTVLRPPSSGLTAASVDGVDAIAVHTATRQALATVRQGGGPALLLLLTDRTEAPPPPGTGGQRVTDEPTTRHGRDPIDHLATRMREEGTIDEEGVGAIDAAVASLVERAAAEAEQGEVEAVADLRRFLHSDTSTVSFRREAVW